VTDSPLVAYFSMELALEAEMPTYAGGLGVLAGDTVRSAADLGVPMLAVSLLHRQGYFRQRLDAVGQQSERPALWPVEELVEPLAPRVHVELCGRRVAVRAWRYSVRGVAGHQIPVYLLDADLPENAAQDRALTGSLYGGDERYRLSQEALLGIAGVRMLRALGHREIERFHLNEGHAALAIVALVEELLREEGGAVRTAEAAVSSLRGACVFTTHTPVPAGHDRFPAAMVREVLGPDATRLLAELGQRDVLNLTDLALRSSHFVNGVAMRHGEVSRSMFPQYPIRSITNGVHPATWAAPSFRALFDRHIPEWRSDAFSLRYAVKIPLGSIRWAHAHAKGHLIETINRETRAGFDPAVFTLGFARRATSYKRATLLFRDVERLARIARQVGPLQIAFAGKAHPHDQEGKALIREIHAAGERLRGRIAVAYLQNYDMRTGRLLCAGSDVWLNTPVPPLEASGTSGMKAALNGVPSLSVLDGWWVEGHVEGITGWSVGEPRNHGHAITPDERDRADAASLYDKLEREVLPCFYGVPDRFLEMMRYAISLNASFFNTQRMVLQYLYEAYLAPRAPAAPPAADA
jgi:starch phosphorylase